MKIFISILSLETIGGISTACLNMLNEIANIHDVTLCISGNYKNSEIVLPESINVVKGSNMFHACFVNKRYFKNYGLLSLCVIYYYRLLMKIFGGEFIIKRALRKFKVVGNYDVAIAYSNDIYDVNGHITVGGDYDLVLNCVTAKNKIAWVHNDLPKIGFTSDIAYEVFKDFDGIVNVSEAGKKILDNMVPAYRDKSYVVYNMYNIEKILHLSKDNEHSLKFGRDKIHFVTVGRLSTYQKRMDRIMKSVQKLVCEGFTNFDWLIVGDGPNKDDYQCLIDKYSIGSYVKLVGHKTNPYPFYKNCDAFILTSQFEGLPMVVREAQILDCPCLITNFASSSEAVQDGLNGIICENSTDGVYNMVKSVLINPQVLENFRAHLRNFPVNNELSLMQFDKICKLNI